MIQLPLWVAGITGLLCHLARKHVWKERTCAVQRWSPYLQGTGTLASPPSTVWSVHTARRSPSFFPVILSALPRTSILFLRNALFLPSLHRWQSHQNREIKWESVVCSVPLFVPLAVRTVPTILTRLVHLWFWGWYFGFTIGCALYFLSSWTSAFHITYFKLITSR